MGWCVRAQKRRTFSFTHVCKKTPTCAAAALSLRVAICRVELPRIPEDPLMLPQPEPDMLDPGDSMLVLLAFEAMFAIKGPVEGGTCVKRAHERGVGG